MSACETLPAGLPLPLDQQSATDRHWRGRLQESTRGTKLLSGVNDDSLDDLWISSVKEYTRLDLTNQTDKRMAVWGVVKRLREMQSEEYVAGMWEGALEEQLAWKVADCRVSERPVELRTNPTWSWTSVKGAIVVPGRSRRWQRSYTVRDHTGGKIWVDLDVEGTRPGPQRKPSENAADMRRELDLANERRRHSSTASRKGSTPGESGSTDDTQIIRPLFRSRTSSPPRTDFIPGSRRSTQYSNTYQNLHTTSDELREKEPELSNTRIAMQGFLHVGRLRWSQSAACWRFEIPHAHDKTTEVNAFPDIQPKTDVVETVFVVLALTKQPDRVDVEIESTHEGIWYEGYGLLLQESSSDWCYRRTGALEIRHLSYNTWQHLQITSSSSHGSRMEIDTTPCKNFFLE